MEPGITAFAYGMEDYIREVAKKDTESDIGIWSKKEGERIVTYLTATRYPEKLSSLTDAMYPADFVLLPPAVKPDRNMAEVMVAASLSGKPALVYAPDGSDMDTFRNYARAAGLKVSSVLQGSPMEVQAQVLEMKSPPKPEGPTTVIVDHFFTVRSVGTVALGFVLRGTLRRHQRLKVSHVKREVQVRSIQVHDIDQEEVPPGTRVGVALKNIETEELRRGGALLTEGDVEYAVEFSDIRYHPAVRERLRDGQEVFAMESMQYQRGFFSGSVRLDREIAVVKRKVLFGHPNMSPRVAGTLDLGHAPALSLD